MKKFLFFLASLSLIVSFASTIASVKKSQQWVSLTSDEVEVLAYENEGPGRQGQRHTQAVWCGGGGWHIAVGCCYGWEDCTYIYCNGNSFSCDGSTWIQY
jgi:hypothetical protein